MWYQPKRLMHEIEEVDTNTGGQTEYHKLRQQLPFAEGLFDARQHFKHFACAVSFNSHTNPWFSPFIGEETEA